MEIKKIFRQMLLGAIFILPFMAIFLIFENLWFRFSKLSVKIESYFGGSVLEPSTKTLILISLFLFCFYLVGNLANKRLPFKLHQLLEKGILEYIPGYLVYKNKISQVLDTTSGKRKAVYFINELEKKPAILIEQSEKEALIFIPSIPDTNNGELVIAPIQSIEFVDMPVQKFIRHLQLSGKGLLINNDSLDQSLSE